MEIRDAQERDLARVAELLGQLGYEPGSDALASDLATGAAGDIFVASDDSEVVGMLALRIHRQIHWGATIASIDALIVDERARSGGIGAALVAHAVDRARSAGAILVELHSNGARADARRFYEREGFAVTSNYFVRHL